MIVIVREFIQSSSTGNDGFTQARRNRHLNTSLLVTGADSILRRFYDDMTVIRHKRRANYIRQGVPILWCFKRQATIETSITTRQRLLATR
jgi:hypothetical protein